MEFSVDANRVLTISNHGIFDVSDIEMRATRYRFGLNVLQVPTVTKLPDNKVQISSGRYELAIFDIDRFGKPSIQHATLNRRTGTFSQDLKTLPRFEFIPPPTPGEPGVSTLFEDAPDNCVYALRFTFRDVSNGVRYQHVKVISCRIDPILPFDGEDVGISTPGDKRDPTGIGMSYLNMVPMAIEDQRRLYANDQAIEFTRR